LPATPGQIESVSALPNLSIYKTGATINAPIPQEEKKILGVSTPVKNISCQSCFDWQLLGLEILLLGGYFSLANKFQFLNKAFSIVVPVGIYILFLGINGGCTTNRFFCRFFFQLDLILFMLAVIINKHKFVHHKIDLLEERIGKAL